MGELTTMPKYEAYKNSGVEWLGIVPKHWDLTRIATRFEERRTKVSDKDFPPLSVTKNGVVPQLSNAAKSNDGDNRKLVRNGDFVINSRSDRKGSSGVADRDGSVSLINIVMEPKNIVPKYCEYLLKSYNFIEEFYRMGHGIVADLWTTRYDEMKAVIISIPPIPEQTAIANFLDKKTAQIDEAIAIKEKQIELLKERKQIIIQQAVTQGLNPKALMKDSGVDWIGEIPEHWEVKKIKYLTKIFRGKFTHRPRNDPAMYDGEYPFFQTGDVARAGKYLSKYRQTLNERGLQVSTLIPKGTVVITIAANIGDVSILDLDACFPDSIVGFSPKKGVVRDFLYYALGNMKQQFMDSSIKNTQMNLNVDRIGSNSLCQPPFEEQNQIVELIESKSKSIDDAIGLQKKQIGKLKEYKTTLINSAVTGKIKVPKVDSEIN
ncbi:type I restriction enzyme, S subunit [Pseudoalteromonas citrea]|uniref:Type I restriction enzyme, S subunit n=2 Tax=Pseudoalteromonas citrea TaxID=43655 RepID=A0AAD4AIQ7_9GAMM|nr:restriction endonuclease subunit S [Pseudoalteromonas citrea]KAF7771435.1 type I restriction enzyme, S subunit [Pseudoalteromonas citrea]